MSVAHNFFGGGERLSVASPFKRSFLLTKVSAPAIGIDLGTTFSCVAVCLNDKVEVIPNAGHRITPSYVAYADSGTLVGAAAKEQEVLDPTNTVFDAKRLIGRKWNDPTVQSDRPHWPFAVVDKEGRPAVKVTHKGAPKYLYPEQISAEVLGAMRDAAQEHLRQPVRRAVVTVPAHFNDAQRRATKDAAAIAGLEVLRIINEPTAAALAFGLAEQSSEERKVVIFDFGGGTFDVTVLEVEEGIFEILTTAGDTHLGGSDIDARLVKHFAAEFAKNIGTDICKVPRALRRLRTACEKAKCTLSTSNEATIEIVDLHAGTDFHATLTRADFEKLCNDLFQATLPQLKQALEDAKLKPSDIDEVVLVGGSTRIPAVRRMVQEFFNGKKLNESMNPDEAVACGAAVQAAILDGDSSQLVNDMVLVDVTPLSLGVNIIGGRMDVIIPRNTTIPTKETKTYYTTKDNQTSVDIKVLEGERPMVKDNNVLGTFTINGLRPAPRGDVQINETFEIDANGILHVTAVEIATGNKREITITNDRDRFTPQQIEKMIEEAEKCKGDDQLRKETAIARHKLEEYCLDMRAKADTYRVSNNDRHTIINECNATLQWLKVTQAKKEDYEKKKNELKIVFDLILNL